MQPHLPGQYHFYDPFWLVFTFQILKIFVKKAMAEKAFAEKLQLHSNPSPAQYNSFIHAPEQEASQ